MKKNKLIILILVAFVLISCNKKDETSVFDVKSNNEKNISVVLDNVKKGTAKKASISVSSGENIFIQVDLIGESGVSVEFYKSGSKDELILQEDMYYETYSTSEGFQEGDYDVYFTALEDNLSGTIEVTSK